MSFFACASLALGCGSGDGGGGTVTVVSELPVMADFGPLPRSVLQAIQQSVDDRDGKACDGAWKVTHRSSDHTSADGGWDGAKVIANGTAHAADPGVVAVIGTFNSGAAGLLIPVLNESDLVLVSPSNTYAGLTQTEGAEEGEPAKFYPTGRRNYARLVGGDHLQGRVAAGWAKALGATRIYVVADQDLYGAGLSASVQTGAAAQGLTVAGSSTLEDPSGAAAVAALVTGANADLVFLAGFDLDLFGALLTALGDAGYTGRKMAGDGLVVPDLLEAGGAAAEGLYVTTPGADPDHLTGAGATWRQAYEARFGAPPEPYATEAYAATQVVLAALDRVCAAGGSPTDRDAVRAAVMATSAVPTVLGPITFDANGDVTTPAYVGLRAVGGEFRFEASLSLQ